MSEPEIGENEQNANSGRKTDHASTKNPLILSTNPQSEFIFLENFVRRLICQLTDMQERKRAANWLKYLKKNESEAVAVNYLLILLLALSRKKLVKPFDVQPPDSFTPMGKLKLRGMCRFIMEQYNKLPKESQKQYTMKVSCSDDFKQYGCVQNLGEKGVHCYCAISNAPVSMWNNSNNLKQYNLKQCATYFAHKMSVIEDKIQESTNKTSESSDSIPDNFLHYIVGLKKFRMPFIGRLHVRGINDYSKGRQNASVCK